jgi:myo-inositol-1(or 4)-monophosphatase
LTKELEAARSAAREAGEVLREGFGWQHSVRYKGEVDLVTEVDEEAERVIREILLGAFPPTGCWQRREERSWERGTPVGS